MANLREEILKTLNNIYGIGYQYVKDELETNLNIELDLKELKKEIQELKKDGFIGVFNLIDEDTNLFKGRGFVLTNKGHKEQIKIIDKEL